MRIVTIAAVLTIIATGVYLFVPKINAENDPKSWKPYLYQLAANPNIKRNPILKIAPAEFRVAVTNLSISKKGRGGRKSGVGTMKNGQSTILYCEGGSCVEARIRKPLAAALSALEANQNWLNLLDECYAPGQLTCRDGWTTLGSRHGIDLEAAMNAFISTQTFNGEPATCSVMAECREIEDLLGPFS